MPTTEKVSYTLTPETVAQIDELARLWAIDAAFTLPKSQVLRICVDRAYRAEVDGIALAARGKRGVR